MFIWSRPFEDSGGEPLGSPFLVAPLAWLRCQIMMSDVRSWCQWWRTRNHHELDNGSDKVNVLLKIIWSYILTQNFWDNNNTDLPQNESNAWWCWISPKASVSLPILIKIMMIKKFMMMLMVTMLTMMAMMLTMMLTMMGPLSLIPNFSPNCSSRLSAYLDFNQQMLIVYCVIFSYQYHQIKRSSCHLFCPACPSVTKVCLFTAARVTSVEERPCPAM